MNQLQRHRYGRTAIGFHWLTVTLVLTAVLMGLWMSGLALSPEKLRLYSYHKWIGVTVLLLTLLRLSWRSLVRPPSFGSELPNWQSIAATWMHRFLYACLIAIPISGWLMSSALGFQTVIFGAIALPDAVPKSTGLADLFRAIHQIVNITLGLALALHVVAALDHWMRAPGAREREMWPLPSGNPGESHD